MPFLRGHHLICLHFFHGEGYDEAFIMNLKETLTRADAEGITITSGADDICKNCPYLKYSICMFSDSADEEIREMDARALRLLGLSSGEKATWAKLKNKLPDIFPEWFSSYCLECDWREACEKDEFYRKLT
jgi:hypothetical protein